MTPELYLHHLIKCLTPGEVKFFRRFATRNVKSGSAKYLKLFNEALKQETYDEPFLKRKVGAANFPALKRRLFELITEALQEYYDYNKGPMELAALVAKIDILLDRALYEPMWRVMARAEALAEKMEDFIAWKYLLDLKQTILSLDLEVGYTPPQLEGFVEKWKRLTEKATILDQYAALEATMQQAIRKGGRAAYETATSLRDHPLLGPDVQHTSARAEIKYCQTMFLTLRYTQQWQDRVKYSERIVAILDSKPEFLYDSIMNLRYFGHVYNMGLRAAEAGDFARATTLIKKLKAKKKYTLLLFERVHSIELHIALQEKDIAKGEKVIAQIEAGFLQHNDKVRGSRKAAYCYQIAHFFLMLQQPAAALQWLLRLRTITKPGLSKAAQDFGEVLFLLCHFDLGNFDVVATEATKIQRHMEKRGALSDYEKTLIRGLKAAAGKPTQEARRKGLQSLESQVNALLEIPEFKFKNHFFPFDAWFAIHRAGTIPCNH